MNPLIEIERLKALRDTVKRNSFLLYFAVHGIDYLLENFESLDEFKLALKSVYNRNHVPRELKKIFEAKRIIEGTGEGLPKPYLEMKEKFIDGFLE